MAVHTETYCMGRVPVEVGIRNGGIYIACRNSILSIRSDSITYWSLYYTR